MHYNYDTLDWFYKPLNDKVQTIAICYMLVFAQMDIAKYE